MSKVRQVTFKVWCDGEAKFYWVRGKAAKTLVALVSASGQGITALELSNTWALRLSHYILVLRQDYGMDIQTLREPHDDGWHGRYVLITPVEIIEIESK